MATSSSTARTALGWQTAEPPVLDVEHPRGVKFAELCRSAVALELSPPARAVVGDDGPEQLAERPLVEALAPTDRHRARGFVLVAGGDDPLGIGRDRIVDEDVHMVLGRKQRADVAIEDEVRAVGALDRLHHVWIGG